MIKLSESKWIRQRQVGHWILRKLIKDNLEEVSLDYLVYPDGRFEIERSGTIVGFSASHLSFEYFIKQNIYSKDDIKEALNFLSIKEYIRYVPKTVDDAMRKTLIEITPAGINAHNSDELLLEVEERESNWPKRNWIKYDLLKIAVGFVIGLVIGYFFRRLTEQPKDQAQGQNKIFLQLPKNPDTARKSQVVLSFK